MSMSRCPRIQLSGGTGSLSNYCLALRNSGGEPVAGYAPKPDLSCDGLVLCGGGDIDPTHYGQENCGSQTPDLVRDRAELALFDAFYRAGKPVFGICRGMQLINVALGGTLIQDLPPATAPFHGGADHDLIHPLRSGPGSLLEQLYGPVFFVNSYHHQAVDRLGQGLTPTAWAEGGFVEGMLHSSAPILAVQFHPERLCYRHRRCDGVDGAELFSHFLAQCRL